MEAEKRQNWTTATEITLVGFPVNTHQQMVLFGLFLVIYLLTIMSNLLIITVVSSERRLHSPMYIFLCNFSFLEIWYTSVTVPKMLVGLMSGNHAISKAGCIVQYYFFFVFGAMENVLLAVMAYDRFVALCHPLRYTVLMSGVICVRLILFSWIVSFLAPVMPAIWISKLLFCGLNHLDHFFCDFWPLLQLSCMDTWLAELTFLIIAWTVLLVCFFFVLSSYGFIIFTIRQTPSSTGKSKAISTCTAHLTVVGIYYSTSLYTYVRLRGAGRFQNDKIVSVFYAVATPLLNPVIYSLRNRDMKESLHRFLRKYRGH
ncbi:olfactory receptor 11L1-like [Ambystoma mexicanum]|uniref:olfactory receptor 11L1-like n=1 Tax=Ambystoma mexicanum TaxID=8296 RepID=UPI0037E8BB92